MDGVGRGPKAKRKSNDRCEICLMSRALCLCQALPQIETRTRLTLVIHFSELRRTSNTGQLAHAALVNSERVIRGKGRERLCLSVVLDPAYQPLLLYPSEDAALLDGGLLDRFSKPIQLIVPDGNWRQASKVHTRHPELAEVPRVFVRGSVEARLRLRREPTALGMATLEAVAFAMAELEGAAVCEALLRLYRAKAERLLWARGQLKAADCVEFVAG